MTKTVRIENADTSPYKVLVQVWDRHPQYTDSSGVVQPETPATLVQEHILGCPCSMTSNVYITSTRYLVVKEVEEVT